MKKWIKRLAFVLGFFVLLIVGYLYKNLYDRHSGYSIDLQIKNSPPKQFSAGFGAVSITPEIVDTWTDANGDARYFEEDGDTYNDNNGNGKFDVYWIAGFDNRRAANGVHDQLWARAMVIDDGTSRIAIVSLDAIGFGSDDVIDLKKYISAEANIDYCIVTSTHTHEAPDLIGIWGDSEFSSGVNPEYMEMVQKNGAEAVIEAARSLRPVTLRFAQDLEGAKEFVEDSRKPYVLDPGVRLIQAVDLETKETIGTLFAWANHPETLWNANLLLSSDFPHFIRHYVENGISSGDSLIAEGLGGTVVYINGSIGGLMTTSPEMKITDRIEGTSYTVPSFEKADAQGKMLALVGLQALQDSSVVEVNEGAISVIAKTIYLPLDNPLFRLAASLGVLDRGMTGWFKMRSEMAAMTIGPASFLTVPGEIYPEIINGGVETPEGADFHVEPLEVPGLRSQMPGQYRFVIGLANDMIGYIIPKSEWDEEAPYIYGLPESPYGEINSISPEVAPIIYKEAKMLIQELKK